MKDLILNLNFQKEIRYEIRRISSAGAAEGQFSQNKIVSEGESETDGCSNGGPKRAKSGSDMLWQGPRIHPGDHRGK